MNNHEQFKWTVERKAIVGFVGMCGIFSLVATAWIALNGYHIQFMDWYEAQEIQTQLLVMVLLFLGLNYFGDSD